MRATLRRAIVGVALLVAMGPRGADAQGPDLGGSVLLTGTNTTTGEQISDRLEQVYALNLNQQLAPYLRLRVGYQYSDLTTRFENGPSLTRTTSRPGLQLVYQRPELSGRFTLYEQSIDSSLEADPFDRRSLGVVLNWRPRWGPVLGLLYRDETNLSDVSVVGRGVDSNVLQLTAAYNLRNWQTSYRFEHTRLDNLSNQLRSNQERHDIRGGGTESLWDGRFSLGLSGQLSRVSTDTEIGEGAEIVEPIPAIAGLFAIDTTPSLGELESHPGLIDGDIQTPASPPIDIGGASTFRNIGLDLGVTRAVSQLEIAVNTVSGLQIAWQVYQSRDNLFWEEVPGATAEFDTTLLRYRIRFPETEDRFFKAINVSVNPLPVVLVTEVRALVKLDPAEFAGRDVRDRDRYQGDVVASFRPVDRVIGSVGFGLSNDQALTAGIVRRDFEETHAFARMAFDVSRSLDLNLGYRFNDSENRSGSTLFRTVNHLSADLHWQPLATVQAVLALTRRRESEKDRPLQSLDSLRLGLITQLLTVARLVTDVSRSRLADPFASRDRITWTWSETLEMWLLPTWRLDAGLTYSSNRTPDGVALLDRTQYRFTTSWSPTAYASLGANVWVSRDDRVSTVNQSYNVSYAPGPKLSVSAVYQDSGSSEGRSTSTSSLNGRYRFFARLLLFATLSRSTTESVGVQPTTIANFSTGLRFSF